MIVLNEKDKAYVVTVKFCFLRVEIGTKKLIRDYESVKVHFSDKHVEENDKKELEYVAQKEAILALCKCYKVNENSIVRLWI
jgi:hypothetical protein